jgi:hypothetical protein
MVRSEQFSLRDLGNAESLDILPGRCQTSKCSSRIGKERTHTPVA